MLNLINGFTPRGAGFRLPSWKRQGKLCLLSGTITGGTANNQAAYISAPLPAACRPHKKLTFNTNRNEISRRFDVDADGQIYSYGGAGFKSLDGIRFVVDGKVLREQIVGPSGELTWRLTPGQAVWCCVELRDSDEGLWAVTNPIFFG